MKKEDKYLGKTFTHAHYGRVKVLSYYPKSRVWVEVEEVDRGAGWDEETQTVVGVKGKGFWSRQINPSFGEKHKVHIKELQQ